VVAYYGSKRFEKMPEQSGLSAETLMRVAREALGQPLNDADAAAVAGLLGNLAADMRAFRKMPVGDDEPATTYNPAADTREETPKEKGSQP
jgi:hypothetical protein